MSGEVLIPPWVRPESPETIRMIDDATVAFQPSFGRGQTQRGIFADPRWGLRRRYRGLRSDEKAAILNTLNDSRGQLNPIRVTPHTPIRGGFATSELVSNGTFQNGATGWTASSDYSISVSDRVLRAVRVANTGGALVLEQSATVSVVQYAPYALRFMVTQGRGTYAASSFGHRIGTAAAGTQVQNETAQFSYGLQTTAFNAWNGTSVAASLVDSSVAGLTAGDSVLIPYVSLARCARVDNSPNDLQNAEVFGSSPWVASSGATGATISSNTSTAPDGNTTADSLVENGGASTHYVSQPVTFSANAHDRAVWCCIKNSGRNFALLQMDHAGGTVSQYFNVTGGAGAVGVNGTTGTGWSNRRAFLTDLGNSWYLCVLVARKSGAQTSGSAYINAASADGTSSYTGSSGNALALWRGGCAATSEPVLPPGNTSVLSSGTTQSGNGLNTKGWPASTSNLLLTGDWVEIGGELKQLTAPVNSDAAGLAYIQFRPGLAGSPADGDAVIVYEPFGRFIYPAGTREFENLFGIYSDCEMNLEEIYS